MSEGHAMDCREAFNRLDDYLDRELTPEEMAIVKKHLECCAHCADEFKFEEAVIKSLRDKLSRVDVPCDLLQKIAAALDSCESN